MPISDEVIELAPVKKTKKTLIIMIAGMGVLFALAVAFLVMYLVKPSVTEDTNHVKTITASGNGLFSVIENDQEVLYASIGNEYTVYSTITVDDDTSKNVVWDCDRTKLKVIEEKEVSDEDGKAYIKFRPIGKHNDETSITVRSALRVDVYDKINIKIVNQGAEDIQVTQYGFKDNLESAPNGTLDDVLEIDVTYYTMERSDNNKDIYVKFKQLGRYSESAKDYLALADGDAGEGKKTSDVSVTIKDPDRQCIKIGEVYSDSFSFTALSSTGEKPVEIFLNANVNNPDCEVITKTIKVNVIPNTTKKFVDTMFVFNKPVVNEAFINRIVGVNKLQVSTANINIEINEDKKIGNNLTLKAKCGNSRISLNESSDFELVLPYNPNVSYNELFRHVVANPTNIQYADGKIIPNWYQNIKISSSDPNVVAVSGAKLTPKSIGKCNITLTDDSEGSAKAKVVVPVRVVAQTTDVNFKVVDGSKTYEGDGLANIEAGTGNTYSVSVAYTFIAHSNDKIEENIGTCINNAYRLDFNEKEVEVKLKGDKDPLKPKTVYAATSFTTPFGKTGSGAQTKYTTVLNFDVKVLKDDDGAAVFRFIKDGTYLYDAEDNKVWSKIDVSADFSASFSITECAKTAELVSEPDGLKIITDDNEVAGNFVRKTNTKAWLYVQQQAAGDELTLIKPENIKKLVTADKTYFEIANVKVNLTAGSSGLSYTNNVLKFTNASAVTLADKKQATVSFEVLNINKESIAPFELEIYIIDAVTQVAVTNELKSVKYGSAGNVPATWDLNEVQLIYKQNATPLDFTTKCDNANLYYNNGSTKFVNDADKKTAVDKTGKKITFKYDGTILYELDLENRRLTCREDIYKYSRKAGENFGNVEIEFLLRDIDEYVGKHKDKDNEFDKDSIKRMKFEFVRKADDVELFSHADCEEGNELYDEDEGKFISKAKQGTDAYIYACSIVKIDGEKPIYVERKSEENGKIAPVEQASFTLPTGLTLIEPDPAPANRLYNYIWYNIQITEQSKTYSGGAVSYSNTSDNRELEIIISNETRTINSIGFYSDADCNKPVSESDLLFGGFINKADKYSNIVYIKVGYNGYLSSHTEFEQLELSLPSYLELVGVKISDADTNSYVLPRPDHAKEITQTVYYCEIKLISDAEVTDRKTITAVPHDHKTGDVKATCTAHVDAGLKTLTVKNGEDTVATVKAGNIGTYNYPFNLNKSDIKSLTLDFVYEAINSEGYNIAYDHSGMGLNVVCPSIVDGLIVENNIKAEASWLTLKIDPAKLITLNNQEITLTFTDVYNGASENNVFTLKIYITVELDIYELAFADDTQAAVTVTGSSSDTAKTLAVNVKYNGGTANTQPTDDVIKQNKVLNVYTMSGEEYNKYEVGDIRVEQTGKTYTLVVPNNIDWKNKFYLGLEYKGTLFDTREIIINTETCHIEFADNNIELTKVDGQEYDYTANVVLNSASDVFNIIANVVNDGSGNVESKKSANYGLYTGLNFENEVDGISIEDGKFSVTDSTKIKITDTVYYRARYVETKLSETYDLKVAITYKLAPNAVGLKDELASALYDKTNKIITLYYNANGYTSIDLTNYVSVTNAFDVSYGAADVAKEIKTKTESSLVQINGLTIKPNGVTNNATTDVAVVLSATYAGVKVENEYTVRIVPIAGVSFDPSTGTVSLVDKLSKATATPVINNSYSALTPTYTFTDNNTAGMFDVSGNGNDKTIALASNTTATKTSYTFTGTLTYSFTATDAFTVSGTFQSTATYTVNVVGDYPLEFNLTANGNEITPYNSTADNKYAVVEEATYGITVTSIDTGLINVAYSANATNVVNIKGFSGKNATVELIENASGAFSITVTATVGSQKYTCTKNYYFMYGNNVVTKMWVSQNDGAYTEFTGDTKSIDFTDKPYKFKYEISGLPSGAEVNVVVNGDVETVYNTSGNATTRNVIITAKKPTTLKVGGSVKIGSRMIYLNDKTVTLTATAPNFALTAVDSVKPSESATFSVSNSANGFQGTPTAVYAVSSTAYATIIATSGVITAKPHVLTDQVVIVTATVTVNGGVYDKTTYTVSKAITVKGMPLPTIKWTENAKEDIGIGSKDYSSLYSFDNVATGYTYDKTISVSLDSTTLAASDYTFAGGNLTINNTATASGTVTLTVTATITSGAHAYEVDKVDGRMSDTITVRVLPTMSTDKNIIELGNAKATYDLNSSKYKSIFAPNGIGTSDYSIVGIEIDDPDFDVDGSNLIVKNNITEAKSPVTVTVSVLITNEGVFKGVTITGTKTITIKKPEAVNKEFSLQGDADEYNVLNLGKADVLGSSISGDVQSINVATELGDVVITNNGSASPSVTVDKEYGVNFDSDSGSTQFDVEFVVTLTDGRVYFATAKYNVNVYKVSITAKIGGEDGEEVANKALTVNSGEVVSLNLFANHGYTVNVKSASANATDLTPVSLGDGVKLTAGTVAVDKTVKLTLGLSVAGKTPSIEYEVTIKAPETGGAAYTADNIEIYIQKGSPEETVSTWTCNTSNYIYGDKVKVQLSSGNLSAYFSSIKLHNNTNAATLSGSSIEEEFDRTTGAFNNKERPDIRNGFTLKFTAIATAARDFTFTVTLTAFNSKTNTQARNSTTVAVTYTVHVIDKLTVTLDKNTSDTVSDCPTSVVESYRGTYINLPEPTCVGYTLDGWYTERKGGTQVSNGDTVSETKNHTLYAHWTVCEYTLDYDVAVETTYKRTVKYNEQYGELPDPTKTGYDFVGWMYENKIVVASSLVQPTDYLAVTTITLTAQWKEKYFTVKLNENYPEGTTWSMPVQEGSSFKLHNSIIPKRDGHRFDGWYKASNGNTKADETITVMADTTIYAHWTQMVTVVLDANGGQFGHDGASGYSTKVAKGGEFALHWSIKPTRIGYRFDGWYDAKNNGANISGTVIAVDEDTTLYAYWTKLYTVSFSLNYDNATGTIADKAYVNGEKYGLLETPVRDDYRFDGWYTSADNTGTKVESNTAVNLSDAQTLYAHWTQLFTVTLSLNGGTIAGKETYETIVANGSSYSEHVNLVPTKDGYTFLGWYNAETDGDEQKNAITVAEDTTLYAYWEENTTTPETSETDTEETPEENTEGNN